MFCPNFKCGSPLSISTECEACGWKARKARVAKTAKPLPFQVEKAEKAARSAERRAENEKYKEAHKATRIEGDILEVTKEQIEGGRSYDKKTVVTMTDGRKYELHPRFPSLNDKRTGELVESFSELDWVCVKEADVVEAEESETKSTTALRGVVGKTTRPQFWVSTQQVGKYTNNRETLYHYSHPAKRVRMTRNCITGLEVGVERAHGEVERGRLRMAIAAHEALSRGRGIDLAGGDHKVMEISDHEKITGVDDENTLTWREAIRRGVAGKIILGYVPQPLSNICLPPAYQATVREGVPYLGAPEHHKEYLGNLLAVCDAEGHLLISNAPDLRIPSDGWSLRN